MSCLLMMCSCCHSDLVEELGSIIHDALDQRKGDVSSRVSDLQIVQIPLANV